MAIFKCKMCGGALNIEDNVTTATCDYCGREQTIPKLNDDKIERLYDRADHFRRSNDFDKATALYEQILDESGDDAESYWSLVLCRYGIEYVKDPTTQKRVPTVHRVQYTSIFDDENYVCALKHADIHQKAIYEQEAADINRIQKGILEISQKEEPFDVFICYKETDDQGRRTHDSVYANELYHELTREGFKVFFARITLEDKLGVAYEPYIFAALNSAKVMVVLGTDPKHFNAVWVKNEWSRYLALIKSGEKKMLIPAYKDMEPYDLPQEFSHLQAQDMNKLGFMPDLVRGIKKIIQDGRGTAQAVATAPTPAPVNMGYAGGGSDTAPLLKRVNLFLESNDWNSADAYCEKVLDIDPENAQAYVYKLMAQLHVSAEDDLVNSQFPLDSCAPYKNAVRFADEALANRLTEYDRLVKERIAEAERLHREQVREAERQRQIREKRRQEINKLQSDRAQLKEAITKQSKEQESLRTLIKKNETEIECTTRNSVKQKIFAGIVLLLCVIACVSFIQSVSTNFDGSGAIAIFCLCIIPFIVFSVLMFKACNGSGGKVFINLPTCGIFSLIYSIITLLKSSRRKIRQLVQENTKNRTKIDQIEQRVATQTAQIQEIDQKIASIVSTMNE